MSSYGSTGLGVMAEMCERSRGEIVHVKLVVEGKGRRSTPVGGGERKKFSLQRTRV